ncbi:MAG TPA: DUF881 domain-containing protein [Candidatus Limnocylindrales bacterium]|nr:DUF881 domain-containing protein [Candidatus Limnocylindrales bacterium]
MTALLARLRAIPSWQVTLGLALLALGFLIAVQLRAEAPRARYSSQERPPLLETVEQLQRTQEGLQAQILELRRRIQQREEAAAGADRLVAELNRQLREARLAAALVELVGPGVVVELEDSAHSVPPGAARQDYLVSANDVRDMVNEVWLAGAEAVSVNGERVGVTTAFTDVGTSVIVNGRYLQPPYVISALGPADLYDRLAESAGFARFLRQRAEAFGIVVGVARSAEVVVAPYAGNISLIELRAVPTPTPSIGP